MCEGGRKLIERVERSEEGKKTPQARKAIVGGGGPEQIGRSRTEGTPQSVSLQARRAKPVLSELRRWQGIRAMPLPMAAAFLCLGSTSLVSRPGFFRRGRWELEGCDFSPSQSAAGTAVLFPVPLSLWQISERVAGSSQWAPCGRPEYSVWCD